MEHSAPTALPTEGSYIHDDEFFALQPYPALLMTFLAVRRGLVQGDDATRKRLGRLLYKSPTEVLAMLEALAEMGAIAREADRGKGRPRRCMIQPVARWKPLQGAAAERWQDPEYVGYGLAAVPTAGRDAG